MPIYSKGLRAPSTLAAFDFGDVRQLDPVAARFLADLAQCSPLNGWRTVADRRPNGDTRLSALLCL